MDRIDKNKPSTMFVQPIMNYKSEEWLAMVYGVPVELTAESKFLVGFAFKTKEYAHQFFDLLLGYNEGEQFDSENKIRLSFVTEDPQNYSVYIYPSIERQNVLEYQKDSEEKFGKETQNIVASLTINKYFPYGPESSFKNFKENYNPANLVELKAFLLKDNGSLEDIYEIDSIFKKDILIKHRKLFERHELEYQHHKAIVKNKNKF
ncbi:hypothetical protein P9654_03040 [Bacillus atrophaeus]|uniref:hypothetical protein n=1 Tax=Bacillus atrophaeus TaxID=1452 RepID=UPI002E200C5A|nr:hypothetical protein [Bacillus atrophaeus]MED4800740.1 hypothetical protein [Bacillus atrophaeus]MED4818859.1 hypothetical protein [Bacillus atrophaeus]